MPFCRHCGDLVLKDRCRKCGGTPVAASFSWGTGKTSKDSLDKWKQTYTVEQPTQPDSVPNPTPSTSSTISASSNSNIPTPNGTRRFPRPGSVLQNRTPISNKISAHISAATTARTPSPAKYGSAAALVDTLNSSPSGNPILDDGTTLSKVYGSVLQDPETLKSYACAECDTVFNRDATLFPDPENPSRMLCRPCFLVSGGVKGECAACQKPVTRLRNEGGFVENSGKIWHEKCFVCDGCSKELASNPSVDLYGRPCCPDCFDTSLQRPLGSKNSTPRKPSISTNTIGGLIDSSKENSPVIDELSRRLGVSRTETPSKSPSLRSVALDSKATTPTTSNDTSDGSPGKTLRRIRSSTMPSQLNDLTKRLQESVIQHTPSYGIPKDESTAGPIEAENRFSSQSLHTPDLTSDLSDGAESTRSGPSTPKLEQTMSADDENAVCGKCGEPLFSIVGGGKIVTVPSESGQPGRYHNRCFSCAVCDQPFVEKEGSAAFVVTENGLTHLYCAPPPKKKIVTRPRPMSIQPIMASSFSSSTSSIYEPPKTATTSQRPQSALSVASPSVGSFSFPSKQQCAGCQKMVALMEPGVVPGPKGTRWHSSCLVCGGKGAQRRMGEPGCGKKLDRDAKSDSDGKIWCSTCMTLITLNGKPSYQSPISATYGRNWLPMHGTGASIASQTTGSTAYGEPTTDAYSAGQGDLTRNMSVRRGGASSPTKGLGGAVPVNRSLSTKRPIRPRPKSISVLSTLTGTGYQRTSRGLHLVQEIAGSSISTSSDFTDHK